MALKAVLDSLDGLPKEIAKEYTEKNGKFILSVDPVDGFALEDVQGLKTALGKEKQTRLELSKQLKAFEGLDPETAREASEKLEELRNFDPEKRVSEAIKARESQLIGQHEKERKKLEERSSRLFASLEKQILDAEAVRAISEEKGNVALLLPHVKSRIRVREAEDGRFVAEVIDANGTPMIGDAAGNPMTIPQLVKAFKTNKDFEVAFPSEGGGGSNSNNANRGGNAIKTISVQDAGNHLEKIASGEVRVSM